MKPPIIKLVAREEQEKLFRALWDMGFRFPYGNHMNIEQDLVTYYSDSSPCLHVILYKRGSKYTMSLASGLYLASAFSEYTLVNSPSHFLSYARKFL